MQMLYPESYNHDEWNPDSHDRQRPLGTRTGKNRSLGRLERCAGTGAGDLPDIWHLTRCVMGGALGAGDGCLVAT